MSQPEAARANSSVSVTSPAHGGAELPGDDEGRSLTRQRNEIEARSVELLSGLTDYRLLTSIPGIGPMNAMTILAEAGDVRRSPITVSS